jgi:ferredoxin-NADP reductase
MGFFTLHDDVRKAAVLLAGGIGITPFRSIVVDAVARETRHRLSLFYANHRPEDAAFLSELRQLAETTSSFRFVPTMTDMARSTRSWQGQTGAINRSLLERALPTLHGPVYYIAGPPSMVTALRAMLAAAGVRDDDVRTEEFTGY